MLVGQDGRAFGQVFEDRDQHPEGREHDACNVGGLGFDTFSTNRKTYIRGGQISLALARATLSSYIVLVVCQSVQFEPFSSCTCI